MDEQKQAGPVDIMIDIETNGTKPGCAIAMIGATTFGLNQPYPKWYHRSHANVKDERFVANPETLKWWATKDESLRSSVFHDNALSIDWALSSLSGFLEMFPDCRVWGNSASFDLKILERAYEICCMPTPWNFRNEMCYRTLKNLYPQIPYKKPHTSHDALEDAIAQAVHADEILAFKAALELGYYNPTDKEVPHAPV